MKRFILFFLLIIINGMIADSLIPYLQSPTPQSMIISWRTMNDSATLLRYGTDSLLQNEKTGDYTAVDSEIGWHTVRLNDLNSNTIYYYQCFSGTDSSEIYQFTTFPENGFKNGHFRVLVFSDNQDTPAQAMPHIAGMKEKIIELYGDKPLNHSFNMVFNAGDIVGHGWQIEEYRDQFFNPIQPLSPFLPFMISIGNHEENSDYFYQFMEYDDFAGPEGEKYYAFQGGSVLFIAVNSNTQFRNETQLEWLEGILDSAEDDSSIDWIVTFCHHPPISEVWPSDMTSYVSHEVVPILQKNSKAVLLITGHSHCFTRGAVDSGILRLMQTSSVSWLARWREIGDQRDFPQVSHSFDHYTYSIIDFDFDENKFDYLTYSYVYDDRILFNVLFDSFTVYQASILSQPDKPVLPGASELTLPDTLCSSSYSGEADIYSSQIQVRSSIGNYQFSMINSYRTYENYYYDTGSPDWIPVDLSEGIDLTKLAIEQSDLPDSGDYYWRVRYRDNQLKWSDWSEEALFHVNDQMLTENMPNQSLYFNGIDDYVEITDSVDSAVLPDNVMTVEFWINCEKLTSSGYSNIIGCFQDNGGEEKGWYAGMESNVLKFKISLSSMDDGDGVFTDIKSNSIRAGMWAHGAVVYDGQSLIMYMNGKEIRRVDGISGSIVYHPESFFSIGTYHDFNEQTYFNGYIDEIRLWESALDSNTIQKWMHRKIDSTHSHFQNLISYWQMQDDIQYNTLFDKQNNNNGFLMKMNILNLRSQAAGLGDYGTTVTTQEKSAVGVSGRELEFTIQSAPDQYHYAGLYIIEPDSLVFKDISDIPEISTKVLNYYWGIFEYGKDIRVGEKIVADLKFHYKNLIGNHDADSILLLKRAMNDDNWQDVTSLFVHDKENSFFYSENMEKTYGEYAIGLGISSVSVIETEHHENQKNRISCFPNPFHERLEICFSNPQSGRIQIEVRDIIGRKVKKLFDENQSPGKHIIYWDGKNDNGFQCPSGVYFVSYHGFSEIIVSKVLLLK